MLSWLSRLGEEERRLHTGEKIEMQVGGGGGVRARSFIEQDSCGGWSGLCKGDYDQALTEEGWWVWVSGKMAQGARVGGQVGVGRGPKRGSNFARHKVKAS